MQWVRRGGGLGEEEEKVVHCLMSFYCAFYYYVEGKEKSLHLKLCLSRSKLIPFLRGNRGCIGFFLTVPHWRLRHPGGWVPLEGPTRPKGVPIAHLSAVGRGGRGGGGGVGVGGRGVEVVGD